MQDRLNEAFESTDADIIEFGPEDTFPEEPQRVSQDLLDRMSIDQDRMMRYWLAGGGLLASAAVLASGTNSGVLMLAIALGGIGLVSLLYSLVQGIGQKIETPEPAKDRKMAKYPPRPEIVDDQLWQNNESAALLSAIHDALGDIAVRRSLNGFILQSNNTFRDLVGEDHPEGKTCQELGIRFNPGPIQHSYDVEIATPTCARTFLWHDVVARDPVLGDLVIQSIARDVTDERQMARQQEAARRRAEMESENKSRLIATVAHEIRTPLSGLLGMGNLLAATQLAPDQANYLNGIRESGTALIHLVEDLLDFSTIEAGRFALRSNSNEIRPLVETITEMLAARAHEKGIEIGTHFSAKLPQSLTFDPARLRQVLYNVAGNAVKFTQVGGIIVKVDIIGADLVIEVADTGPGMNETELDRIFGEFEQGDIAGARESGVGLGLAISARILNQAGGKLTVASEIGKGTTFVIRLPIGEIKTIDDRSTVLASSRVIVVAPAGPASEALNLTLRDLGAQATACTNVDEMSVLLDSFSPTDIIVDHRLETVFKDVLTAHHSFADHLCRLILLVDPESRPSLLATSMFHAWLIRPLRENSLVDVLLGRMKGLEPREESDDSFPTLSAEIEEAEECAPERVVEQGYNILVGEDDPVNAMITQAILERAGHRVRLATNFTDLAALLADGSQTDLLISDVSMPGGNGLGFLAALRSAESSSDKPALPVVMLTADTSDATRRDLLTHGASLVLPKPADQAILPGAVDRLCKTSLQPV